MTRRHTWDGNQPDKISPLPPKIRDVNESHHLIFHFVFFLSQKDEDKQDKKGVDIEELLRKEGIDTLTYMGWEPTR